METIIGDCLGNTIGIHSPIPYTKNQTEETLPLRDELLHVLGQGFLVFRPFSLAP